MLTGATMAPDFASEEDLLDRLTAQLENVVFLVGSAVTAPGRAGEPGGPRVDVIEQIRQVHQDIADGAMWIVVTTRDPSEMAARVARMESYR